MNEHEAEERRKEERGAVTEHSAGGGVRREAGVGLISSSSC